MVVTFLPNIFLLTFPYNLFLVAFILILSLSYDIISILYTISTRMYKINWFNLINIIFRTILKWICTLNIDNMCMEMLTWLFTYCAKKNLKEVKWVQRFIRYFCALHPWELTFVLCIFLLIFFFVWSRFWA